MKMTDIEKKIIQELRAYNNSEDSRVIAEITQKLKGAQFSKEIESFKKFIKKTKLKTK